MRQELSGIAAAIEACELPDTAEKLFGTMWDDTDQIFVSQETFILDFKDKAPSEFRKDFGASIVRLALAFHNTYGGVIVFGVQDENFAPVGMTSLLDVEALNDVLTDMTGAKIECLCREYRLKNCEQRVQVLLVPRRGNVKPVRLIRSFDKYLPNTLWLRDRHSVREATENDLSILYSDRLDLSRSLVGDLQRSVHESLPPSPATMNEFIGRKDLLDELWDWFVFGTKPRLYLHGEGGAGKSTLAYEFSRMVAERGAQVAFANAQKLDYVIFVSGKETELNPYSAAEQPFALRQFDSAESQFRAILVDSGMRTKDEVNELDEVDLLSALTELFATYSGLIVIDDVDALSRRGKDTGEESLLITCLLAAVKRTRVLYTLRYPPTSALNSSVKVPELEARNEFPSFIEACARQFSVEQPSAPATKRLAEVTSRLPLLIETVIGLRKVCGNYERALDQFESKGGDGARRYLYQREYDRLGATGRSREVLAALLLLDEPVSFSVLKQIIGTADSMVRDALSECGSVFLSTQDNKSETQYQLATPAKPFIADVSTGLKLFPVIERRVQLFIAENPSFTPEEAALIVQLDRLVRQRSYEEVVSLYETRNKQDPVIANQKVQALVGQAYANLGPDCRAKARECFTAAKELQYYDIFMARGWFHVESQSEYGNRQATMVCDWVLSQKNLSTRDRAEFKNKLGNCYFEEARRARNISPEKAIEFYSKSVDAYLSGLWIGRNTRELNEAETLRWLEAPVVSFVEYLQSDIEPYLGMIEGLTERGHDIHMDGAKVLLNSMRRSRAARDERELKKVIGLVRRTVGRLNQHIGQSSSYPGFSFIARTLGETLRGLAARNA